MPTPINIALCSKDSYISNTIAEMLMDMGYFLTPELHHADLLITDQPAYLSIEIPTIFLYDNLQPSIKKKRYLPCIYLEKPAGIEQIHHIIKQLVKKPITEPSKALSTASPVQKKDSPPDESYSDKTSRPS